MQVIQQARCFRRHVSINHPEGAKFCKKCDDYVLVDSWHKCTCCMNKVPRQARFLNTFRRLEEIVEQNRGIIDCYLKHPYANPNMPGFVIFIDWRTYLVSIKHIAEFASMPRTRDPDKIRPLIERIQAQSSLVYPGTKIT